MSADRPVGASPEPWEIRVRALRDSYRKAGDFETAQQYEDHLAARECRLTESQEHGGPVFE